MLDIGDRVKITAEWSSRFGRVGRVVETRSRVDDYELPVIQVRVHFTGDPEMLFYTFGVHEIKEIRKESRANLAVAQHG